MEGKRGFAYRYPSQTALKAMQTRASDRNDQAETVNLEQLAEHLEEVLAEKERERAGMDTVEIDELDMVEFEMDVSDLDSDEFDSEGEGSEEEDREEDEMQSSE